MEEKERSSWRSASVGLGVLPRLVLPRLVLTDPGTPKLRYAYALWVL